jgi:hypothetical protein
MTRTQLQTPEKPLSPQQIEKYKILRNLDEEWDQFIGLRLRIQESVWQNFAKPVHTQDKREDRLWADAMTKLVTLHTKLMTLHQLIYEERIKSDIKLYTWQKVPTKKKLHSLVQKQRAVLDKYFKLKTDFLKTHPLEPPIV